MSTNNFLKEIFTDKLLAHNGDGELLQQNFKTMLSKSIIHS